MTTFSLNINCAACGGEVRRVNGTASQSLSVLILECCCCEPKRQWEVTTRMVEHAAGRSLRSRELSRRKERAAR